MAVNKVILLGNLGKDPELRYTSNSQTPVCSFSLATSEKRKDQSGAWVDHTEWHNVVVYGKQAENCSQYLKKGRQAYLEGKIQTRKWQDKEGKDRYTTEIIAQTVQFIGGARGEGAPSQNEGRNEAPAAINLPSADEVAKGDVSFNDDDIPF